eukprot:5188289-Pyramimonas_sp.AAC.1
MMSARVRAWRGMAFKQLRWIDVGHAAKMIQDLRQETKGAVNPLDCARPPRALLESVNQRARSAD